MYLIQADQAQKWFNQYPQLDPRTREILRESLVKELTWFAPILETFKKQAPECVVEAEEEVEKAKGLLKKLA